jgi:hypothetical protein
MAALAVVLALGRLVKVPQGVTRRPAVSRIQVVAVAELLLSVLLVLPVITQQVTAVTVQPQASLAHP